MRYREQVEAPPSHGWMDTFPFLMARQEERKGVPTGKLKVLVLESGGNSWPDEFVLSVKNPGHELRKGQREEG